MSAAARGGEPAKSVFDRLGAALPVALTMIATAFAGMSTSEMTQAMYWRSAAAQDQGKVNDQWGLAGFKRNRSLICQTAAAQLRAAGGYRPLPVTGQTSAGSPDELRQAAQWLVGNGPPAAALPPVADPSIQAVLDAVRARRPEAEVVHMARGIDRGRLEQALHTAEEEMARVEQAWEPVLRQINRLVEVGASGAGKATDEATRTRAAAEASALQAARYEVEYRRYRAEATLNQGLGFLYEVRVKSSVAESDRHRDRSKNFFYAMLAAQVGATVASLGLARQRRSLFWTLASIAGIVAVAFGAYVYLGM
jgi:hypothetical protein